MTKKLVFDTLEYANMLKISGVEHADVHSAALATAISENVYTTQETDKMFDQALKKSDERNQRMRDEFQKSQRKADERHKEDIHRIQLEMKEIGNLAVKKITRNIGIMIAIFTLIEILLHTHIKFLN